MTKDIKKILQKIIDAGFQAYIVGGYVRDYILGRETNDIDICTNALPKELMQIFADDDFKTSTYGSLKLNIHKYSIDINTYRKELKYEHGKLTEIEYINDLDPDIKRRDFTINALYMDINGHIIDKVNGLEDLRNKTIRVIGDINAKFQEDPLRILRALRLKITHDLIIDSDIIKYIHIHKEDIKNISGTRKKEEITKMLISQNAVEGFNYLKELQILDILKISYTKLKYVDDINAMFAQLNLPDDFPLTKEEKQNCEAIKEVVNYGKIDYGILFKYGLYICSIAGKILGINSKTINKIYKEMPLKSIADLKIDGDDIQKILNIEPSKIIKNIMDCLVILILNKKIINEKDILIKYVTDNKGMWLKC